MWQLFRGTYQMRKRPLLFGGAALLAGYAHAAVTRVPRAVSPELMQFHRRDQMKKLGAILRLVLRFERVDAFRISTPAKQEHGGVTNG